ncbi:MAG: 3'(2'),5'-bisphosphate nucleotidase CysQ [Deltaproteobacteria bacterium]|nr:3'(2'),5'-bisphosphate nucleotidase CysQ [Deltaproteobacteria bacterium]MBM4390096.1 3'(2'),5'-bisphosphate nucleotidase CysQ [Deltaproteobacteria bacterium]
MNDLLRLATDAALEAGAAVRSYYRDRTILKDKGEDNPLTEADLASDQILASRLRAACPDFGWLSEESVDDPSRLNKEYAWIVDPLDGTKEFTLGIPEFVVSIGLVRRGAPVLGVLYNPIADELFSGVVGEGASFNGQPCRASSHAGLQGARVVCSRTEMKKGMFERWTDRIALVPVGSVAYKFGRVAAGQAEATFTPQPRNEWDICGGVALVLAAGGRATNGQGEPYVFNRANPLVDGVCATNGIVHDEILGLMRA